jgi:hypothetical protein
LVVGLRKFVIAGGRRERKKEGGKKKKKKKKKKKIGRERTVGRQGSTKYNC